MVHKTAGYAHVVLNLSGADAGLEILNLVWRCRALLTDTHQAAHHLPTPYGSCGFCELYEVLDDDGRHAGAKCRQCASQYDAEAYTDLAREQAEPVRKSGARRRSILVAVGDDVDARRA